MANNLRYWDSKLHLEKMRELIKVVLVNQSHGWENFELKDINFNEKLYNVSLDESGIQINCSDGRKIFINLNPKFQFYLGVSPQIIYMVGKDTLTVKGDSFKTSNVNIDGVLDRHFVYFDDFYNDNQLIRNIDFYTFNGKHNVEIEFNGSKKFIYRIFYNLSSVKNYYFKINDDSIVFGSGGKEECLVSLDGKKFIAYNGLKVPSYDVIKDVASKKEQIQRIKDLLKSYRKMNLISRSDVEIVQKNLALLDEEQELCDKYMRIYNYELPICREALQKRGEFLKNLDTYTFSEDELEMIINLLKEEIIARINKDNEKAVVKKKSLNR